MGVHLWFWRNFWKIRWSIFPIVMVPPYDFRSKIIVSKIKNFLKKQNVRSYHQEWCLWKFQNIHSLSIIKFWNPPHPYRTPCSWKNSCKNLLLTLFFYFRSLCTICGVDLPPSFWLVSQNISLDKKFKPNFANFTVTYLSTAL